MLNMIKTGALALALTGATLTGIAPAAAATIHTTPVPGVHVTIHNGPNYRHRHRVRVCRVSWHHHHRVRVCEWVWRRR